MMINIQATNTYNVSINKNNLNLNVNNTKKIQHIFKKILYIFLWFVVGCISGYIGVESKQFWLIAMSAFSLFMIIYIAIFTKIYINFIDLNDVLSIHPNNIYLTHILLLHDELFIKYNNKQYYIKTDTYAESKMLEDCANKLYTFSHIQLNIFTNCTFTKVFSIAQSLIFIVMFVVGLFFVLKMTLSTLHVSSIFIIIGICFLILCIIFIYPKINTIYIDEKMMKEIITHDYASMSDIKFINQSNRNQHGVEMSKTWYCNFKYKDKKIYASGDGDCYMMYNLVNKANDNHMVEKLINHIETENKNQVTQKVDSYIDKIQEYQDIKKEDDNDTI